MRIKTIACLGLILVAEAAVRAQDIVPPPRFSPTQEGVPVPPAPGIGPNSGSSRGSTGFSASDKAAPLLDRPFPSVVPGTGGTPWEPDGPFPPYNPNPGPIIVAEPVWPSPRLWFRAEALYWWTKASPLPAPLLTAGSLADATPGALGQPGTSVLIGNENVNTPGRAGGRFTLGFSLDAEQTWGLEGTYFFLAPSSTSQNVSSDGSPDSAPLAFPFFNPNLPGEDSSLVALPGTYAGSASVTVQDFFQGAEANLLYNVQDSGGLRWDVIGGFRYLNLQENLSFVTDSLNVFPTAPGFFHTFDRFNANNNFYGGQIGVRASYDNNRLFLNGTGKLALGETSENVGINGGTFTNAGGNFSAPGGYLSQPTNMGSFSQSRFAIVPEVNFNLGVRLSPWASIVVGYSFLYISSVARPGDQIDRVINPTQAPAITNNFPGSLAGQARPAVVLRDTDFWVQGLNFGLEFRY